MWNDEIGCQFCKETHEFNTMRIQNLAGIDFKDSPLYIRSRFDLESNQLDVQVTRHNQPAASDDNIWSTCTECNYCPVCGRKLTDEQFESDPKTNEAKERKLFKEKKIKWAGYGDDGFIYEDDYIKLEEQLVPHEWRNSVNRDLLRFIYRESIEPNLTTRYIMTHSWQFANMMAEASGHSNPSDYIQLYIVPRISTIDEQGNRATTMYFSHFVLQATGDRPIYYDANGVRVLSGGTASFYFVPLSMIDDDIMKLCKHDYKVIGSLSQEGIDRLWHDFYATLRKKDIIK